jgi:hypothetical protein
MFFIRPLMHGAGSDLSIKRRNERSRSWRGSPTPLNRSRIARAFYCDVLQGQQVWEERHEGDSNMSFIVEGTRIEVGTSAASDGESVVLSVLDPSAVAERCWDAGYSVRVGDDAPGEAPVSVIDPFGRRIDLVR